MNDKCERCQADLVGNLEKAVRSCSDCIKVIAQEEVRDLHADKEASTKRIMELSQELETVKKKLIRYEELRKAEVEGITAAQRGLDDKEDPYHRDLPGSNDDLSTMWLAGHAQGSAASSIQKLGAMMLWAVNSLLTIEELVLAYHPETAVKIQTIRQKLMDHLDIEVES